MARQLKAVKIECNFCGKPKNEVGRLIIGDDTAICDECVNTCMNLLQEERAEKAKKSPKLTKHINPVKIKEHLDQYIVGQDNAKVAIAVGVANHYKRLFFKSEVEVEKSNILVVGPTGSGKTMLAKTIARFLNVPFIIADATSLTEAGYVGDDVESIIQRLLNEAEGVQQALLKMVEGTICRIPATGNRKHQMVDMLEIDTRNILFIVGGAFNGLDEHINKRLNNSGIGFGNTLSRTMNSSMANVSAADLMKYGMIPEFVGRFPILVHTDALTTNDMIHILEDTKHNLLAQYKFYFNVDNIELEFTKESIIQIVEQTQKLKIGARGLKTVIEEHLQQHLFKLPEYKRSKIKKIVCTADTFRMAANTVNLIGLENA